MYKHKVDFLAVAFCLQLNFVSVFKVFATERKRERRRQKTRQLSKAGGKEKEESGQGKQFQQVD